MLKTGNPKVMTKQIDVWDVLVKADVNEHNKEELIKRHAKK